MTMAYDPWKEWTVGDDVSNGSETGVIEATVFTNARGDRSPRVRITDGRRKGRTVWPWEKPRWTPQLNHPGILHFRLRCEVCQRVFWAPARFEECRTCARKAEAQEARRERDRGNATFAGKPAAKAFAPAPVVVNATPEQRARVDQGRVDDDADCPF